MNKEKEVRIVILHRGFVIVGYYQEKGPNVTVSKARMIQVSGTTQGFAELVNGPLSGTILQAPATYRHHILAQITTLECNPEKWESILG